MGQAREIQLPLKKNTQKNILKKLMCNYSVKQKNPSLANTSAALCRGPGEILLSGALGKSVPEQARGVRHGGKLMDLVSKAEVVVW